MQQVEYSGKAASPEPLAQAMAADDLDAAVRALRAWGTVLDNAGRRISIAFDVVPRRHA